MYFHSGYYIPIYSLKKWTTEKKVPAVHQDELRSIFVLWHWFCVHCIQSDCRIKSSIDLDYKTFLKNSASPFPCRNIYFNNISKTNLNWPGTKTFTQITHIYFFPTLSGEPDRICDSGDLPQSYLFPIRKRNKFYCRHFETKGQRRKSFCD